MLDFIWCFMRKRKNYLTDLYRYSYLKLIVPIKRERHNPEYVALGTAVGLFCGLTPIVWQMNIVFVIWLAAKLFKIHFSEGIKQTFIFWGKPILMGSIIYMVFFSILGYFIAYRYASKLKEKFIAKHRIKHNIKQK